MNDQHLILMMILQKELIPFNRTRCCVIKSLQKAFLLQLQKSKQQKISICKCEKFLTFDVKNVLPFWWGKFNQNKFTDLKLTYWPVHKLQVSKLVLIEFSLPEWQNVFHIKCQKLFTFANGYLLLF